MDALGVEERKEIFGDKGRILYFALVFLDIYFYFTRSMSSSSGASEISPKVYDAMHPKSPNNLPYRVPHTSQKEGLVFLSKMKPTSMASLTRCVLWKLVNNC